MRSHTEPESASEPQHNPFRRFSKQPLLDWDEWALAEAEKLDPILSGQIMSHLDPPQISPEED